MNLSYTTTKNSYTILNDTTAWIVQSNLVPYSFPYARESVEESAQAHIDIILEAESRQEAEVTAIDKLKLAIAEVDEQRESDKTDIFLALSEIAELGGN